MKPRAVRISIHDASVSFQRRAVTLINISRSGALIRVHAPAVVGSTGRLVITHAHTTVQIDGRVARTRLASTPGASYDGDWEAGVEFVSPTPPEVAQLLKRVISLS